MNTSQNATNRTRHNLSLAIGGLVVAGLVGAGLEPNTASDHEGVYEVKSEVPQSLASAARSIAVGSAFQQAEAMTRLSALGTIAA